MTTYFATLLFALLIAWLHWLDHRSGERTSKGLWISVIWLSIASSRMVSEWLASFGFAGLAGPASANAAVDGSPVDRNALIVLLVCALVVLVRRGKRTMAVLRSNLPLVVFLAYCLVSVSWSAFPDVAFKRWIKMLGDVAIVLIVLTEHDRRAALKRLLNRVAFLLLPTSILFIKYIPDLGRTYRAWVWTPLYTGVTLNKNTLGMICLVFGLGSLWRFLSAWPARRTQAGKRTLFVHGVIIAMAVWLIHTANSMTSFSCLVLAGSLMVSSRFVGTRRAFLVHFLFWGIVLLSLSTLFFNVNGEVLESMGRDSSLTGRTDVWNLVLSLAGNPIIGTGYESFWLGDRLERMAKFNPDITQAHNGYLELYLNLGWVGIVLFAVVILSAYRSVMRSFRRDPDTGSLWLAYFATAVVYNFTEAAFKMMSPIWIFFLLAVTASIQDFRNARPSSAQTRRPAAIPLQAPQTETHYTTA